MQTNIHLGPAGLDGLAGPWLEAFSRCLTCTINDLIAIIVELCFASITWVDSTDCCRVRGAQ